MEQNSTTTKASPFDYAQQKQTPFSLSMTDGDPNSSTTTDGYHLSTRVNREHGHFRQLFWRNKHATVTYCMVFWAFGMCVAFLGPTLWDLGCQTGTTIRSMTWVFFAQSLFILIGSMTGGVILQRFPSHNIMLFGTIMITVTLAVIPACKSVGALAVVLATMGFNMGLIDTTANVSMLRLYGLDVSPFLQALHFFYGLGAFLSPMIAEPFLKNFDCTKFIVDNSTVYTSWFEQNFLENQWTEVQVNPPKSLNEAQKDMQIHEAFWIMATLQIPVVLLTLSLVFKNRIKAALSEKKNIPNGDYENIEGSLPDFSSYKGCCTFSNSKAIAVVSLACFLLFMADGMQGAFGGLIFTYGHVNVKRMTMKEAASVNAVFWGFFACGRLFAILAALYFAPGFMLFCDIMGSLGAMILLLIFRHSLGVLYVGTAIFGLFLSNVYPTTISLTEQFIEIGPSATSCIVVGAASGEMLYPVMVGNLLYKYGPDAFLAVGNITLFFMVFVFVALWVAGMYSRDRKTTEALLALWFPKLFNQQPVERGVMQEGADVTYYRRLKEDSMQSLNNFQSPVDATVPYQSQKSNGCVEKAY